MHKQQGWPQAWEYCQAKQIQTLGRASQGVDWSWSQCIKSYHAQTSSGKGLPSHFWTRECQKHLTWAVEKKNWTVAQWSKVLFSDESKFCISFGNQGPRVWRKSGEAQNSCCLKSSVKFPQSVMIWAAMSSAGVGPLFSEVHSQRSHLPGNFRALHASFCWQALWRCWFHFSAGLGTCPHCQRYQKLVQWPWCYCAWLASKLPWPEPLLSRGRWDTRPNNADELKATVKETWASIPPQQCHKLITSMPRRIEAVIKAKGAPTKYWVHIQ